MIIKIESQNYAMALEADTDKRLRHIYFGQKLQNPNDYNLIKGLLHYDTPDNPCDQPGQDTFNHVYTPSGTWNLVEPAIQLMHADGNASLELNYVRHEQENLTENIVQTIIQLEDPIYGTGVQLTFKVYQKENIFEQWSLIKNRTEDSILLKKFASANLYFRNKDFYLTQFYGTWATEMQPETHRLTSGIKTLDTKLGTRAHMYGPPTFLLSFDGIATENSGKVLLANLAWSGNFRFDFERDRFENLRLIAGINNHASEYQLEKGEHLETPHFIYTYSENGKAEASRNMHRWSRKYRIHHGEGNRMTLLNNWEATFFDFDEEKLVKLFDSAKKIGVDLFLLDDGWFANKYPRNDDTTGLGDWEVNVKKLPRGLRYLVEQSSKRGLKFGIWIEPEMVNPKSELYENHPDWVIRQPNRKEYYYRQQLVLDLCNPLVQNYVFGVFDRLFQEAPDIAYVKWDCNTVIYNAHSAHLEREGKPQSHLYVDYVKGLYTVLEKIRVKYPDVSIMLCSGGGSRVDFGALPYFNEIWLSDNTSPIDRVFMHWEYSHFYPATILAAHVTDWDKKASIKFRTDVASMGRLGFDLMVDKLSERDQEFCRIATENYNGFKDVVLQGDCFRLQSPYEYPFACMQYVNKTKDQSVVFSYLISNRFKINYSLEPVLLKGLDPNKKYRIRELNLYADEVSPINQIKAYSGEFLMKVGFNPEVTFD